MTTHIVQDDILGTISRRMWEVQRRLLEGTLDPSGVARSLQSIVEATEVTSRPLVTASPFFAEEEVQSNYGYPQGYALQRSQRQFGVGLLQGASGSARWRGRLVRRSAVGEGCVLVQRGCREGP